MKRQFGAGAHDSVLFRLQARSRILDRAKGGSPYFPRVSSKPVPTRATPAGTPVRGDHPVLPTSLKDWLNCKEALDIRRRTGGQTQAGTDA